MYVKDGIAHAGDAAPELEVASARYVGNLQMAVTFAGGEERLLDATELSDMPALAPPHGREGAEGLLRRPRRPHLAGRRDRYRPRGRLPEELRVPAPGVTAAHRQ